MAEKISKQDAEKLVLDLAKKGITSEKIGLELKKLKIDAKSTLGRRISHHLKENNMNVNPDIENLKKTVEELKKHLGKNKHDEPGRRALIKREAKLRKLQSLV
jgi:ribosomal protein S15P/S13E